MPHNPDVGVSGGVVDLRPTTGSGARSDNEAYELARSGQVLAMRALDLGEKGASARLVGEESAAERFFQDAVAVALQALHEPSARPLDLQLRAAQWALACGDAVTARHLLAERSVEAGEGMAESWAQISDTDAWLDAWLIATVRRSPPDELALNALVRRYWKPLFSRCRMLTSNRESADDLAQDTWCRVLRGRDRLKPGGNFRAYLLMIATNLWRDSKRSDLRAGSLADGRVSSLDREITLGDGPAVTLAEILPDLTQLEAAERASLKHDLDQALERLETLWRDVLIARFLDGESCAEIGHRYGRTEQTASGWVRRALSEMKCCMEDLRRNAH